jgi:hypothetical protein
MEVRPLTEGTPIPIPKAGDARKDIATLTDAVRAISLHSGKALAGLGHGEQLQRLSLALAALAEESLRSRVRESAI